MARKREAFRVTLRCAKHSPIDQRPGSGPPLELLRGQAVGDRFGVAEIGIDLMISMAISGSSGILATI